MDLIFTVSSILVELNRFEEAEELINYSNEFSGQEKILLNGRLELMLASILVFIGKDTENAEQTEKTHNKIIDLLKSARDIFDHFEWPERVAETLYIEALQLVN